MISSEVQRTLVKSPPELWAELSDPAALARHLGELGEIRIVRTEPESIVEWTAENTTGIVTIKPSGWGTKVTLSVTCDNADQQPAPRAALGAAPGPTGAPEPGATDATEQMREPGAGIERTAAIEPDARAADPDTGLEVPRELEASREPHAPEEPDAQGEPALGEPGASVELDAARGPDAAGLETPPEPAAESEPAPRRGFFARLFGRRRPASSAPSTPPETTSAEQPPDTPPQSSAIESTTEQPDAFAAVRQALEPDALVSAHPFAVPAAEPAPADISAELLAAEDLAAEQVSAEQVTAVLTAVLDRLGAAHHRPFSRA
jgi:hypothetical protein